jgi:alanine dehydrogenase
LNALRDDQHLARGLNVHRGHLTSAPVAKSLGIPCVETSLLLEDK